MTIQIKQQATPKTRDWWDWSVWLDGAKNDLDRIGQVVYTLHPTFPNPVVTVSDRKSGFRLDGSGWGEFTVHLHVKQKDGSSFNRKHYLRLSSSKAGKVPPRRRQSVFPAGNRESRLTVFVSGGARDLDAVNAVREAALQQNVEVVGPQDFKAGQDPKRSLQGMIARADAAVFVISGRPNLWLNQEINAAVERGVRHIVPLVVGADVDVPDNLRNQQAVRVESPTAVREVAARILSKSLGRK